MTGAFKGTLKRQLFPCEMQCLAFHLADQQVTVVPDEAITEFGHTCLSEVKAFFLLFLPRSV